MYALTGNYTSTTIQPRPFSRSPPSGVIGEIDDVTDGSMAVAVAILTASLNVLGRKGLKRSKPEHFILSLSVADLLVAIVFPVFGIATILGGPPLRNKWQLNLLLSFTVTASTFYIFVIALVRPIKYRVIMTTKATFILIAITWIISVGIIVILRSSTSVPLFQSFFILKTSVVMIIVYGYLAYHLFNRYQSNLPTVKTDDQSRRISYNDKRRDTLFSTEFR